MIILLVEVSNGGALTLPLKPVKEALQAGSGNRQPMGLTQGFLRAQSLDPLPRFRRNVPESYLQRR